MNDCPHFRFTDDTPQINQIGLGVAALTYQQLGFPVLPLERGGKKPHHCLPSTGGVHNATLDVFHARTWWLADPAANIGIPTGSASRLLVIDLDTKGGSNGYASFSDFLSGNGLGIPAGAPVVRTPSGGAHIWLRTPPGARVSERPGILPGVDVKGDGGLVVAPPSMKLVTPMARPGERPAQPVPVQYGFTGCPCQIPDAPGWIPYWLESAPAVTAAGPAGDSPDFERARRDGVPRGHRNRGMYLLACSLYRRHGSRSQEVTEMLRQVWDATDHGDFTWSEVMELAASARKFVAEQEQNDAALHARTMGWLRR